MANKNALNKNSLYVSSLVDFILDTKPYHTKLTEIVEEYRFYDDVKVSIKERFSSKMKIDSTWMYNYFSSANPLYRTMPVQRLVSPSFTADSYLVGRDENKDLALVPHAYSKKTFDGVGVNTVYVRHTDFTEPLTESVDYFQSHGSFQFQIKQTLNANGVLDPLWSITPDDDLISAARSATRRNALDRTKPGSAINRITGFLNEIQAAVNVVGGHAEVQRELNLLFAIVNADDLPRSYEALLAWLAIPNENDQLVPLDEPRDRQFFEQQFSLYSSPLFFNMFTDLGIRESGRIEYPASSQSEHLRVSNLVVAPGKEIEEWIFTSVGTSTTYRVTGTTIGFVGFVTAGESFDNGRISFTTSLLSMPTNGDELSISPTRKLVIGATAPLETWNIIKVNPIAHDRPVFSSPRFGNISDLNGKLGDVSILDQTLPTGDIILTARGDGRFFDLSSVIDPSYTAAVTIGSTYNDGKLGFTINNGQASFAKGDRFYLSIENLPAYAADLELGYGYDMDPYDDDTITDYLNGEGKIGFYYDGRFTDFDLASMNLQVSENAIDGRKWHLRALPDYARPIANVPGLPGQATNNLQIYYANRFKLEYSDDNFQTKTSVAEIPIGESYASTTHGISLTVASASRPFVSVSAYDPDTTSNRIEGGDIFSFEVKNPYPRLVESPVGLASLNVPRLIMHSDSFFKAPAAAWTVTFDTPGSYTIRGTDGTNQYGPITSNVNTPGVMENEGLSFRGIGIHFTIVPRGEFVAGEKFTFNTFERKPTYLVHGSVTGFTAPAEVGKYYWNGKIGFKIRAPYFATYVGGQKVDVAEGKYTVREDCPSLIYTFVKTANGYQISRSDLGISGFGSSTVQYKDTYLTIDLAGVTEPEFQIVVDAHDYPLWNSADVVILNPQIKARLPMAGETVVVEKTEDARFGLNLVPNRTNVSALNPITIDQRFIDLNTRGLPLEQTSPEVALLQGWIPLTATKLDSPTSVAEFSDPAVQYVFRSTANNQTVGTLKQQDPLNKHEPIMFEWDEEFFEQYLPLNAEANLVIQGTGWNDRVHARISESVKFLLGGGALAEDWLFRDFVNVTIQDDNRFNIVTNYNDDLTAAVDDGPFGGFMSGYDNLPWDGFATNLIDPNIATGSTNPTLLPDGHRHFKTDALTPNTLAAGDWVPGTPVQAAVTSLPKIYTVGEKFYSKDDSKLYIKTATGWNTGETIPQSSTPVGNRYFDTDTNQVLNKSTVTDPNVVIGTTGSQWPAAPVYVATNNMGPYWLAGEIPSPVHGCAAPYQTAAYYGQPGRWHTTNYFQRATPCGWVAAGFIPYETLPTVDVWTPEAADFGVSLPPTLARVYNQTNKTIYSMSAGSWLPGDVMDTDGNTFPGMANGYQFQNTTTMRLHTIVAGTWDAGVSVAVEEELSPGSFYDVGQPPDLYSLLAKRNLTDAERADILKQWDFYLLDGQMPTTGAQWAHLRNMLAIDPVPGVVTNDIGYSVIGLGMDIVDRPEGDVGAAIKESMVTVAVDRANLLDSLGYDVGKLDKQDESTAIIYSGSAGPTEFDVDIPVRVFEVSFNLSQATLATYSPTFSILLPDSSPIQVAVVERVRQGVFRFSIAKPSTAKIIVS